MLPKTMKAAILQELNQPLVVDEVELPAELGVGQVLIKIAYSGICGSQLGEIKGVKGEDKYLPHLLGHEGSGIVKMVGPGVKHVQLNDHVVLHWKQGKGIESVPPIYRWKGGDLNAGLVTTFSEYSIVSENRLTPIDKETQLDIAALYGCAVSTGFGVIENNAKIKPGESLVIFGAGGVGLNMIQAASLVSAYPIIAIDLFDNRLELARSVGATHIINSKKQNAEEEIKKIVNDKGLDVFVDNTGQPSIIELGYHLTNKNGRLILVGVPQHSNNITIHSLPLHFGKTLTGSHGGESIPEDDIPRYEKLLKAELIQLKPIISEYFSLNDINIAINGMKDGSISGRCLIKLS